MPLPRSRLQGASTVKHLHHSQACEAFGRRKSALRPLPSLLWLLLCGRAVSGCTDAELQLPEQVSEPVLDNNVRLEGSFCAQGAGELESFLKILLVVDQSNSTNVTDPNNQRIDAASDLVEQFIDDPTSKRLAPGVAFGVVGFFGDVVTYTQDARGLPGFSTDGADVLFALTRLARTSSNTGYDKALSEAFLLLDRDMARLPDVARERSRYEVIFISDGMPFPNNCAGEANSPTAAVDAVERIASLEALHGVDVTFHTGFISDPRMFTAEDEDNCDNPDAFEQLNSTIGAETRALLQEMASVGGGSFKQFDSGDAIDLSSFEVAAARRLYALSNFVVTNTTGLPNGRWVASDSDADGLADSEEDLLGTRADSLDSDGDGVRDAIEWRFRSSGFDPLDPTDAICPSAQRIDADHDGLLDCEEILIGTRRRALDSDADGLPDGLELQLGSSPTSPTSTHDRQADADADGGSDAQEVRWHTDPAVDDVSERAKAAYRYFINQQPLSDGRACYAFDVENVGLASTRAKRSRVGTGEQAQRPEGWNRIMLYAAQTPYDAPFAEPLYRVACVDARYIEARDLKQPASGRARIPRTRPADTYGPSGVLQPRSQRCQTSVNQECGLDTLWCRFEPDGSCGCYRPPTDPQAPMDGTYVGPCPACSNGQDDDGDGLTDYPYDPDCFDSTDESEGGDIACANGRDDDGDGLTDWPQDPGCESGYDTDETDPPTPPECSDGTDNNADGTADYPEDPRCDSAADALEGITPTTVFACDDGIDNDGDGDVDMDDAGCADVNDIDEQGPSVCFFCELASADQPNQCDVASGYCKPRSGLLPGGASCSTRADCRGAPCVDGRCAPCLEDADCDSAPGAGDGLCDVSRGWCLEEVYSPSPCSADADCAAGNCMENVGVCAADPYWRCTTDADCRAGEVCSELGYCLAPVFETGRCTESGDCARGRCDQESGWCVPEAAAQQCGADVVCPGGRCTDAGYCIRQSFVRPQDFRPEVDCVRAR